MINIKETAKKVKMIERILKKVKEKGLESLTKKEWKQIQAGTVKLEIDLRGNG